MQKRGHKRRFLRFAFLQKKRKSRNNNELWKTSAKWYDERT